MASSPGFPGLAIVVCSNHFKVVPVYVWLCLAAPVFAQ
jgi:hypothetical protein